jgi:hypothetical protein
MQSPRLGRLSAAVEIIPEITGRVAEATGDVFQGRNGVSQCQRVVLPHPPIDLAQVLGSIGRVLAASAIICFDSAS